MCVLNVASVWCYNFFYWQWPWLFGFFLFLSSSSQWCSCSLYSVKSRQMNLLKPLDSKTRSRGRPWPVTNVNPGPSWLRPAQLPPPLTALRAVVSTSLHGGTTYPGVCTATTSAATIRRWRWSVQLSTTVCVAAKKGFSPKMTFVSDIQSASLDLEFKLMVSGPQLGMWYLTRRW